MRKWVWGALAAILCVAITLQMVNFWQSVISVVNEAEDSEPANQIYYLVLVDQLSSNPSFSRERSGGGEAFISFNGDVCEPVKPQPLADKLSQASVGRMKVRVDCDSALQTYLWIEKESDGRIVAGYVCNALCGAGSNYRVLRFLGFTILARGDPWVDQMSPPAPLPSSS